MAFMAIRPTTPGECLVIPKAHVDHFTDLDDETAQPHHLTSDRFASVQNGQIVFSERGIPLAERATLD